jgi:hypothetical protein
MHSQTREHFVQELARAHAPRGASTARRDVTSNASPTSGAERTTGAEPGRSSRIRSTSVLRTGSSVLTEADFSSADGSKLASLMLVEVPAAALPGESFSTGPPRLLACALPRTTRFMTR